MFSPYMNIQLQKTLQPNSVYYTNQIYLLTMTKLKTLNMFDNPNPVIVVESLTSFHFMKQPIIVTDL